MAKLYKEMPGGLSSWARSEGEVKVKVHNLILSQASESLEALFTGPFAELNKRENKITQVGA
jgi:hypothetical protein